MSIQILDDFPKAREAIKNAGKFEADQMLYFAVQEIMINREMTAEQKDNFDEWLLDGFKYNHWMK